MNRTSERGRLARGLAVAATTLALWASLVLLFAAPLALTDPPMSWRQAVRFGASFWALWLLFLPAVAWLAFRLPIQRRRLLGTLGVHCLACSLVVVLNRASVTQVIPTAPRPQHAGAPARSPATNPPRLAPPGAFSALAGFRATLDILVYWSLVGASQAIINLRRSQERERRAAELEARLTSARLQALRMQINPHFLFNALNSIATLVYVDPRAADEMLADLGGLLRRSLGSPEEQEITLGRELEFVRAYVNIESRRCGDRLEVDFSVPDELLSALVPAFLLQPLVENAIRHGIEPRRGPGVISVRARRVDRHLQLVVQDNGRGWPGGSPGNPKPGGVGLANTRGRLEGLYGADHRFSAGPAEPQGCRVEVHLPFHLEPVQLPGVARGPDA